MPQLFDLDAGYESLVSLATHHPIVDGPGGGARCAGPIERRHGPARFSPVLRGFSRAADSTAYGYRHYNRGVYYGAQGDAASALKDYDAALRIDPKLVPALQKRAVIYRIQSNFSGSFADYSDAIRLQPKMATLWSERSLVEFFQRDYRGAVKDGDEAIRLDPNLAQAHFYRGMAYGRLGDLNNARNEIETAVRLDPSLERYVTAKQ
jgi:tetratricopeptide (TPR) repeat protein